MKTASHGLGIIKHYEQCRLKAYLCPANIWTIGWGHTNGVKSGDTCTQAQADKWLEEDLLEAERAVARHVRAGINQNQFDALVSFVYNLGGPQFAGSTLLKLVNGGDFASAADQFGRWVFAKGVKLDGLVARRSDERHLFLLPILH